jgi:protein associated with RNAse G/E
MSESKSESEFESECLKKELIITNNTLKDIVGWLKDGHFVCIFSQNLIKYFHKNTIYNEINEINENQYLIYINVSTSPSLVCDDEWPWYILNEGYSVYKNNKVLPTNSNKIYNFKLN